MVQGVTKGYESKLELVGVGFRATVSGKTLNLTLGFSHPVTYPIPDGITIEAPSQTEILIKGIDRQRVGQIAAEIRDIRPPEPYKGKGVSYADEQISLERRQEEVARRDHMKITKKERRQRRAVKTRAQIRALKVARLTVHRTPRHIYAQLTDAKGEHVIASASTLQQEVRTGLEEHRQRRGGQGVGRASPSAPRPPASAASRSIARVFSITAASRRWPRRRAKPA